MSTTARDVDSTSRTWWEKMTDDAGEGTARKLVTWMLVLAIVILGSFLAWRFFSSSRTEERDANADLIGRGLELLPVAQPSPDQMYGKLRHPRASMLSMAGYHDFEQAQERGIARFNSLYSAIGAEEEAAKHVDEIKTVLAEFDDAESGMSDSPDAWLFWHTRQQLCGQAAVASMVFEERKSFFQKQVGYLDQMMEKFADHPILSLEPDPTKPGKTVMDIWRDAAVKEVAFLEKLGKFPEAKPDENLTATIELDNGKTIKLRFYSQVSPAVVLNFITHARNGSYDGTAFHSVNAEEGTMAAGNPMSRLAPDRKFLWHIAFTGHFVTSSFSTALKVKRGVVTAESTSSGLHGYDFVFHLKDPEKANPFAAAFAEVTDGLDALDEWLATDVHDEVGLDNAFLPRVRLGIKKVTVEGEIEHALEDSWRPNTTEPEVPEEVTDAEKKWVEAVKAGSEAPKDDEGDAPNDDEGQSEGAEKPKEDGKENG